MTADSQQQHGGGGGGDGSDGGDHAARVPQAPPLFLRHAVLKDFVDLLGVRSVIGASSCAVLTARDWLAAQRVDAHTWVNVCVRKHLRQAVEQHAALASFKTD